MVQQLIFPAGQVAATTPLKGTELVTIDAGGATESFSTTAAIAALATVGGSGAKFTTVLSSQVGGAVTMQVGAMTGAQIVTASLTGHTGPYVIRTPGAAEIIAAIPNAQIGASYILNIQNLRSTTAVGTLTASTGVVVNGTATIAQNAARSFNVALTSATVVTITSIGAMSL